MANVTSEGASAQEYQLNREMVCRLKAMIRATWPEEFNVRRASLRLVQPGQQVFPDAQSEAA